MRNRRAARHGTEGELLGHFSADKCPAGSDLANRLLQLRRSAFLGEVATGARLDRANGVLHFLVHAQHQNAQPRFFGAHQLDQFHAATAGHRKIEHQHVNIKRPHPLHDLNAVSGLADHLHALA